MNRYKNIVILLRLLVITIVIGTLVFIILPFYLHFNKDSSMFGISFAMKDKANYEWLMEHEKLVETELGAEEFIFADEQILNQEMLDNITHKSLILECVFHKLEESEYKIRDFMNLTGIKYSGFSGQTYQELSLRDEIPQQIISQYEEQTGEEWNFYGEGIILNNLTEVIVLLKGIDYKGTLLLDSDTVTVPYMGKFEITTGSIKTEAKALFRLKLTAQGKDIFQAYHLEDVFPAYYEMRSPLYQMHYFAGEFSSYQSELPSEYEILPFLMKYKGLYSRENHEKLYWQWYYPTIVGILEAKEDIGNPEQVQMLSKNKFYVEKTNIYIIDEKEEKKEFFSKGVNLGAALPGKEFTEFPDSKEVYKAWLLEMEELHVNTVRVYTLLPPLFYEALYEHNYNNPNPIYLMQEIWPEENPVNLDYLNLAYNEDYQSEIQKAVDAIHGNANIKTRQYRAYGLYRFDVSEYLLGYLVGRELEPDEVLETDKRNKGYLYQGDYLYSESEASPTEGWLAASCDYVLKLEAQYGNNPLVGIVSWPTLDLIEHDSEWNAAGDKSLQYNDKAVVDINHIGIHKNKVSGFFGAYHIYPNYPDFMNNDTKYTAYKDEEGSFRYGGYLKDFMSHNLKYPAIVAEYGASTSMYTAHFSPDGYHHGGLSEEEQADAIIRMTKSIIKEGYAGAIIFEWMDEWAKKTWITEPYMIPYNRNPYWHNAMDPEQNYGLIAYRTDGTIRNKLSMVYKREATSLEEGIEDISVGQDESFLYLQIKFSTENPINQKFQLRIHSSSDIKGSNAEEYIIQFDKTPQILVNPSYNWIRGYYLASEHAYDQYEELIQLTNAENTDKEGKITSEKSQNLSNLQIGTFEVPQNHIQITENAMIIRLPYGLLGISDPSTNTILYDDRIQIASGRDEIQVHQIQRIEYELNFENQVYQFQQELKPWNSIDFEGVKKVGFTKISQFFKEIE
jgi:hypothetical protein